MIKNSIHNPVFRIFAPLFYGVIMYILILLIFDSIQQLSENFFSIEVFLCLSITYLIFEALRIYTKLIEKRCPINCKVSYRILIQLGGSILISLAITTAIISFYFTKLVGFSSFSAWLSVFNTIFILTSVLYNMVYFSFFFLNRININLLEQENLLKQNLEIELNTYKNKINPTFLYDSLEILIGLAKQNPERADQFIAQLSDVYRNTLSSKKSELSTLANELKVTDSLFRILDYKYKDLIRIELDELIELNTIHIVSGTLIVLIEDILNKSIVSSLQPLAIQIKQDEKFIEIKHSIQDKIIQQYSKQSEISQLNQANAFYGDQYIQIKEENEVRAYSVPVFADIKG